MKCAGILRLLFGHKYIKSPWYDDRIYTSDYCWRCGKEKGS